MGRIFNREKRILLLMREYVLGGAEKQFRYLIEYAEQHEWKLDVVIEHDLQMEDISLKKASEQMTSVRFYELDGNRTSGKLFWGLICHIVKIMPWVKYNTCLIYFPRDLVFAPFMHSLGIHVIYSERVDISGIADNPYYQKCLKYCWKILANSVHAKKELEQLTGRKVALIRNGKPAVEMLPAKEERQIRRILVPARIAPPKNQMLPLYYLKCCRDFDGKMVFAGLPEDRAYMGKLKQFVRKNELQDKVEFLGHVEDMGREYEKADLVLLPSFAEGTPNIVLEAYAYGRPVIVSDISAGREIVPDSRLRFAVNNPEGIGQCVRYVQEMSDKEYKELIETNRKTIIQNYSIHKMAESFYWFLVK